MKLWNFVHGILHIHVYELLAIVLLAVILAAAAVHALKEKKPADGENAVPATERSRDERGEEGQ